MATYRSYENSVIGHTLPIAIEEYGEPSEVGIPGDMAGYIAKFERTGVHDAEIAFWNEYGSFGDTLTGTGGSPNGAYWLYKWYADMTGNMLTTTPANLPANSNFDGFASATADGRKLSVVFGGNTGAEQVTLNDLNALNLGNQVNVSVQYVPSRGRTAPVAGPLTLSNTTETVTDSTLTVPINSLSAADGYRIVVTPAVQAPADLSGTYKLGNLGSGLDLTPVNNSGKAGTAVEQDSSRGNSNQQWTVKSVGSGNYTIQNDGKGLFLGTDSTANGAGVTLQQSASAADDQLATHARRQGQRIDHQRRHRLAARNRRPQHGAVRSGDPDGGGRPYPRLYRDPAPDGRSVRKRRVTVWRRRVRQPSQEHRSGHHR